MWLLRFKLLFPRIAHIACKELIAPLAALLQSVTRTATVIRAAAAAPPAVSKTTLRAAVVAAAANATLRTIATVVVVVMRESIVLLSVARTITQFADMRSELIQKQRIAQGAECR